MQERDGDGEKEGVERRHGALLGRRTDSRERADGGGRKD